MARPLRIPIASGTNGWDGSMDDVFKLILDAPFPPHRSAALTEANVAATFAAASYDQCIVWVNHTVYGYVLYYSDGTTWLPFDPTHRITRTVTAALTLAASETAHIILIGGTLPYTVTLMPAASVKGRTFVFKTVVTGTATLDANATETIDGALTATLTALTQSARLYSDGTSWYST